MGAEGGGASPQEPQPSLPHDWYDQPLPDTVQLGEGSWTYSSYAFLHHRSRRRPSVTIGRSSGVYDGCFFDLGPRGEVSIGHHCTLVGVIISSNGRVEIGDYALLAHRVVLADSAWAVPAGPVPAPDTPAPDGVPETAREPGPASDADAAAIRIGRNAWIGCGAILLAGADIGENAIVGARAVVDGPVPPGMLAVGNPYRLRPLRGA